MDNNNENENIDSRNSNTEYLPTKCRITKPPPPKPATNPMQFVKVAPCPLFQKAAEQIKKVEEIKKERKEVREEPEDWQQNLDNWKSCRRKRQEHIIERVVEVKKLEQEEHERNRRRNKTFNEMIEERTRGRHKFNIPVYDDDSNDLSDYGIGSSSSKTNSIKDVDTDDSNSILDEKDNLNASNQSQSEDETPPNQLKTNSNESIHNVNNTKTIEIETNNKTENYTYEGAIQDYRSRIRSNIHMDDSILKKHDVQKSIAIPKGDIFKRKELFESDTKTLEINNYESPTSRRLSEDFVNSQSIKQRLKSLEKCTDQSLTRDQKENAITKPNKQINKISTYLITAKNDNNNQACEPKQEVLKTLNDERSSSPETEMYMNDLKTFNRDLDNLFEKPSNNGLEDFYPNYPPSTSSTELMGTCSSDREDSGIHTADVSCSVSQADEPIDAEDSDFAPAITTAAPLQASSPPAVCESLPDYIEKLELNEDPEEEATHEPKIEVLESEFKLEAEVLDEEYFLEKSGPNDEPILVDGFPLTPLTVMEPPKVKPPPPPTVDDEEPEVELRRLNSTKRIKRDLHIKRSSFLGLDEPTESQIYPDINVDKPDFLQKEMKSFSNLKKIEDPRLGGLSKVESHDSGLDIDRGRLSSDTWCSSSIGESVTPSPERQESEQTSSITSEEDEITKKEREIIEMVEKEEKCRPLGDYVSESPKKIDKVENEPFLGGDNFSKPYFPSEAPPRFDDGADSEVLKVERDLCQLEQEEFKRKQANQWFEESRAKALLQKTNRSLENIFDDDFYAPDNHRRSMSDLPHERRRPRSEHPNAYSLYNRPSPDLDVRYRKSMPDIQHVHRKAAKCPLDHGKSLPDIASKRPMPILPGKPIRPIGKEKEAFLMGNAIAEGTRSFVSSAVPKTRPLSHDSWLQPRQNVEKSSKQHWLIQEAELRRIKDQSNGQARSWTKPLVPPRQEKHLPDSVIQTLTQRTQNRAEMSNPPPFRRLSGSPIKEGPMPYQKPFVPRNPAMGHALLMPYSSPIEESQDRMLSVSGKKKCSNCSKELGRGAAMIIESLCLFYHMECFICCVCRMQLGDGRMGTDVRVRNQKLHCHNCYSSDDGIKFSCV